jgi:hypothetical protein
MLVPNVVLAVSLGSGPKVAKAQGGGEQSRASQPYEDKWLLSYRGKTTNQARWDPRLAKLLEAGLPNVHAPFYDTSERLAVVALTALSGPPDDVSIESDRYVTLAACVPHVGEHKGLLWVDTGAPEPEMIFAAVDQDAGDEAKAALYLYTRSAPFAEKLPPQFISSLTNFLSTKGIKHLTKFTMTGPSGATTHPPISVLGSY